MEESRLTKYNLIIRKKEINPINNSELDILTLNDRKTGTFLANFRMVKVSELLHHVGDDQKYQKLVLLFLCVLNFFYAFIAFMIPNVFYEPSCHCKNQMDRFIYVQWKLPVQTN